MVTVDSADNMITAFVPAKDWQGQAAYLIGGGSSLALFDFKLLAGKNTIGINDAFKLGESIVKICMFGDATFFHKNVAELDKFKSQIVTCSPNLFGLGVGWLKRMKREKDGLYSGDTLGWNHSTGAAAINLAISKGATEIYLLGYDAGHVNGKTHWHRYRNRPIPEESYLRFIKGFKNLSACITPQLGVKIYNVTDGSSHLPVFDRMDWNTFYAKLK